MALEVSDVGARASAIVDEVEKAVVGKRDALELLLLGLLADGHVLIEDYPGLAKTLMARSFAQVARIDFSRIQFTPDLMPSDVTGSSIFNQREADFEFRPGPIFANLLLADEINRAPPKTQAALLEAMQERQVTTEGETRRLGPPVPRPRDPEPDRVRGHLSAARGAARPLPAADVGRLSRRARTSGRCSRTAQSGGPTRSCSRRVIDREALLEMQRACESVHVSEPVGLYMVDIVAATRESQSIQVGASPRGSLALLKLSRCRAALDGRDYVTPDDVKAVAVPALAHRLTLRPELWVQRISAEDVVRERLDTVPTPAAEDLATDCDALRPSPKLRGYAGLSAVGLLGALAFAPPGARRADGAVPARADAGSRSRPCAAAERPVELDHDRALEGDDVAARLVVESATPVDRLDLYAAAARGLELAADETRSRSGSRAGERRELDLTLHRQPLGRAHARPAVHPRAGPARPPRLGGGAPTQPQLRVYPRESRPAPRAAAARDAGLRRQRGRAAQGRGNRVRRHPPVRPRRSAERGSTGARARAATSSGSTRATPSETPT